MLVHDSFEPPVRLIAKKARAYWRTAFPERYRRYKGSILPPPDPRMGGPEYGDDEFFLASAVSEAGRVLTRLVSGPRDRLLDIGCGHGRLPIGLIHESANISYMGLDVSRDSIEWCRRYLQERHPAYQFQHINVVNALDNPTGHSLSPDYRLPVGTAAIDIVYLWGVLTNMEPEHLPLYAKEFFRVLRPGGKAFVTAHVEDDVPESSVNPENYTPYACHGPLHAVRYERNYFIDTFRQVGLTLTEFGYHAAGNCQSDLYFVKR